MIIYTHTHTHTLEITSLANVINLMMKIYILIHVLLFKNDY